MVTVHGFEKWDQQQGENIRSRYKCTADGIQKMHAEIIPWTAEEVDESALDSDGRYDPKAQSEKPDAQRP